MTVKAWLEGHQFDLDHLAQLLPTGDIRVVRDGDRYYLTSPQIDNPPAGMKSHEVAERLIKHVNGLGWTSHSDFRPVCLARIYDDEAGTTVVPVAAHLEARGALSATVAAIDANGNVVPPEPPRGPDRIALAASNADVDEVFDIASRVPLTWLDLRRIHEIICRSVEPTTIIKLGWTTENRDSTFTSSASNPAISGSDAIHARPPKGNQPKRKMSISEGRQYIRDLVTKWLDYLAGKP